MESRNNKPLIYIGSIEGQSRLIIRCIMATNEVKKLCDHIVKKYPFLVAPDTFVAPDVSLAENETLYTKKPDQLQENYSKSDEVIDLTARKETFALIFTLINKRYKECIENLNQRFRPKEDKNCEIGVFSWDEYDIFKTNIVEVDSKSKSDEYKKIFNDEFEKIKKDWKVNESDYEKLENSLEEKFLNDILLPIYEKKNCRRIEFAKNRKIWQQIFGRSRQINANQTFNSFDSMRLAEYINRI